MHYRGGELVGLGEACGHTPRLTELTSKAPAQIEFLSGEPRAVAASMQHLSQLPSYGQVWTHLLANEAEANGVCIVTLNTRDCKRADELLVQVHDFVDGLSADLIVPYAFNGNGSTLFSVGEPEIVDLVGAMQAGCALGELGVEVGFLSTF